MKDSGPFKGDVSELLIIDKNPPLMVPLILPPDSLNSGENPSQIGLPFGHFLCQRQTSRNLIVLSNARQLPIQIIRKTGTIVSV